MSTATLGSHPTISPLSKDQAAPSVQPIFDKLTHVFGHMPSFFATMARSPQALEHFMPLYSAVIDKGTVDAKLKDLAYLKTALINGCEYSHRAHSASGKKKAITDEQIKNLAFLPGTEELETKEKAVLLYAERVTRGASAIRPPAIQELKQYFNDDQIVELTLTICIANFTNRFNDAMQCTPDIP
jgi:uncharacterized peroxidase-related enzyme